MMDANTRMIDRHLAEREAYDDQQEMLQAVEKLADAEERIEKLTEALEGLVGPHWKEAWEGTYNANENGLPERIWAAPTKGMTFVSHKDKPQPVDDYVAYVPEAISEAKDKRITELEAKLAKALFNPKCAKCGHPKSNHPFRHPFQELAATRD